MTGLAQDVRFGLRMLARAPGFTIAALLALAPGIGASSAMFSILYGVLFKPLPYREPRQLVRVYENNAVERFRDFPLSPADFTDYFRRNRAFESMATYMRQDQQFGGDHPERLIGLRVSREFFHVFGASPLLGRDFTQEEESTPGATDAVIISYSAWQRLFAGNPHIIGRAVPLSDSTFHVVGVMPPRFEDLRGGYRMPQGKPVDIWLAFNALGDRQRVAAARAFHFCNTVARLKPGVSIQQAQEEMNRIARGLESEYSEDRDWRVDLRPLQNDVVGKTRPTLFILSFAVAFVLLIACVNVANLLLARSTVRERERAIRTALGASRGRLIRQALTESVTLSALGGALGLLLGWWGVRAVAALGPEQVPRLHDISFDLPSALVTAALAIGAGLICGVAPAFTASTDIRRSRPRGVLVSAEVALSFVLLVGAGLLLRSFATILRVDPGFNPRGVLTMSTSLSYGKLIGARRYSRFYERFVDRLEQLPGVTAAGASSNLPWTGANDNAEIGIEGRARPAGISRNAYYVTVTPDFLRAIGVPLVAGRWFTLADHFDAPHVALVNRVLALRYWPTEQACLGHRIYTMPAPSAPIEPMTIVGVVGDVKDSPTDARAQPAFYQPFQQNPAFGDYLAVRTRSDSVALVPAIRAIAREMGNDLSIQDIRPMEQVTAAAVATQRLALDMIGLFAGVALALALIGIYGVMSYATGRRAREIAIRIAIGAGPVDNLVLMLAQGARWIVPGLVVGAAGGLAVTRTLRGLLYQVSATDPLTFAITALILAFVAVAACIIPARRVLGIDPMETLRHE